MTMLKGWPVGAVEVEKGLYEANRNIRAMQGFTSVNASQLDTCLRSRIRIGPRLHQATAVGPLQPLARRPALTCQCLHNDAAAGLCVRIPDESSKVPLVPVLQEQAHHLEQQEAQAEDASVSRRCLLSAGSAAVAAGVTASAASAASDTPADTPSAASTVQDLGTDVTTHQLAAATGSGMRHDTDKKSRKSHILPRVPLVQLATTAGSSKAAKQKAADRKRQQKRDGLLLPGVDPTIQVSQVMKGCWQLGGVTLARIERKANLRFKTLRPSYKQDVWGGSELMIGQFLRLYPWERSNVQLVTHLTITDDDVDRLSANMLQYRLRGSLARLGVSRVDLVLLQWEADAQMADRRPSRPGAAGSTSKGAALPTGSGSGSSAGLVDAALWLSDLQGQGLTRGVGMANLDVPHLLQVVDAGVPVAAHQVQYSLLDRRPSLYTQHACQQHGIPLLATGTMAGGWLSGRWLGKPASKAALDTLSKAKYGAQLKQAGGWSWLQDVLQAASRVASKHDVPLSAVALRWVLQQPGVAALSLGARNASHLKATQAAFTFTLDEEDLLELDAAYEGCPNPPHTDVYVWERGGSW